MPLLQGHGVGPLALEPDRIRHATFWNIACYRDEWCKRCKGKGVVAER